MSLVTSAKEEVMRSCWIICHSFYLSSCLSEFLKENLKIFCLEIMQLQFEYIRSAFAMVLETIHCGA